MQNESKIPVTQTDSRDNSANKYPFGPMGIGEMLEKSFFVYKNNLKLLFLIALIPQVFSGLFSIIQNFLTSNMHTIAKTSSESHLGHALLFVLVALAIILIALTIGVSFWALAAGIFAVEESIMGRKIDFKTAYKKTTGAIVSLIWGTVVVGFRITIGFLLLIVPGILAILNNYLYQVAIVLENLGGSEGAARSRSLIINKYDKFPHPRWYVLAFCLVAFGIGLGIVGIMGIPTAMLSVFIADEFTLKGILLAMKSPYVFVPQTIINMFVYPLVTPIFYIFITVLYFDLKHKKEGFPQENPTQTS